MVGDTEMLSAILESLGDGVIVADENGKFIVFNAAAERLLGLGVVDGSPSEWATRYGVFYPDMTTPYPAAELPLTRAIAGHVSEQVELFIRNPHRPEGRFISISGRPVRDATGAVRGGVIVFHDITARKELDRFKDETASLLVHDLKNPMTVILSNLEYLTEEFREVPVAAHIGEALTDASSGARRGLRLIGNLLDLSRLEQQRFVPDRIAIDIGALLREVSGHRRAQARAGQVTVEVIADPELRVEGDEDLLMRVVENIFDNALRYTPAGGRIVLRGHRVGERAQLRVCNTGDSIPAEVASRVFEKYSQGRTLAGRRMNLGLGLYFCRLAVEAHGGRIWTETSSEFPTIFALELPR
jgi:signal transduction histidine kinase